MIHVQGVDELVDHEVPHHRRTLEKQAAVETDRAARRAAPPTRALASDEHPLIAQAELARALGEARREHLACAIREPAAQCLPDRLSACDAAREPQQSRSRCGEPRPAGPAREMNAPTLLTGGQVDLRRWEGSRRTRPAPCLLALALDPRAMSLEEALQRALGSAGGDHDLDAAGMKDAHRQTSRALAFAHAPPLGGVLVGPEWQLGRYHIGNHRSVAAKSRATS